MATDQFAADFCSGIAKRSRVEIGVGVRQTQSKIRTADVKESFDRNLTDDEGAKEE